MLEFPKFALTSIYLLRVNICMRNYGVDDVSKHVNTASKHVNIARVNVVRVYVASRKYSIFWPWSRKLLTSPLGGAVTQYCLCFLSLKIALNYSVK